MYVHLYTPYTVSEYNYIIIYIYIYIVIIMTVTCHMFI